MPVINNDNDDDAAAAAAAADGQLPKKKFVYMKCEECGLEGHTAQYCYCLEVNKHKRPPWFTFPLGYKPPSESRSSNHEQRRRPIPPIEGSSGHHHHPHPDPPHPNRRHRHDHHHLQQQHQHDRRQQQDGYCYPQQRHQPHHRAYPPPPQRPYYYDRPCNRSREEQQQQPQQQQQRWRGDTSRNNRVTADTTTSRDHSCTRERRRHDESMESSFPRDKRRRPRSRSRSPVNNDDGDKNIGEFGRRPSKQIRSSSSSSRTQTITTSEPQKPSSSSPGRGPEQSFVAEGDSINDDGTSSDSPPRKKTTQPTTLEGNDDEDIISRDESDRLVVPPMVGEEVPTSNSDGKEAVKPRIPLVGNNTCVSSSCPNQNKESRTDDSFEEGVSPSSSIVEESKESDNLQGQPSPPQSSSACRVQNTPDIRIQFGCSWWDTYDRKLKDNDVVAVPELFGREKNMTCYSDLMNELEEEVDPDRISNGQKGDDSDNISKGSGMSPTIRMIEEQLCEYFNLEPESVELEVNFRRKESRGSTFKFIKPEKTTCNITIIAFFGLSRELAFLHAHDNCGENGSSSSSHQADNHPQPSQVRINFALNNNSVVSFGQGVAARWMVGNYDNPEEIQEREDNGTVAVIAHGFAKDVIREFGDSSELTVVNPTNKGSERNYDGQKAVDDDEEVVAEVDTMTNQNNMANKGVDNSVVSGLGTSSLDAETATTNSTGNQQQPAQEEPLVIDLCDDDSEDDREGGDGQSTENNNTGDTQPSQSFLYPSQPQESRVNYVLVQPFRIGPSCSISKNDVVLTKHTEYHPGNNRFRELIKESAKICLGKDYKMLNLCATDIVRRVRSMQPSGRFLNYTHLNGAGVWYDVGDQKIIQSIVDSLKQVLSMRPRNGPNTVSSAPEQSTSRHIQGVPAIEIMKNDVLFCNVESFRHHFGNIQYKKILEDVLNTHAIAGGHISPEAYAMNSVQLISKLQPKGRFLKPAREESGGWSWHEMREDEAIAQTASIIRAKASAFPLNQSQPPPPSKQQQALQQQQQEPQELQQHRQLTTTMTPKTTGHSQDISSAETTESQSSSPSSTTQQQNLRQQQAQQEQEQHPQQLAADNSGETTVRTEQQQPTAPLSQPCPTRTTGTKKKTTAAETRPEDGRIGMVLYKDFGPDNGGWYWGKVTRVIYDDPNFPIPYYHVHYSEDDDEEDMSLEDLKLWNRKAQEKLHECPYSNDKPVGAAGKRRCDGKKTQAAKAAAVSSSKRKNKLNDCDLMDASERERHEHDRNRSPQESISTFNAVGPTSANRCVIRKHFSPPNNWQDLVLNAGEVEIPDFQSLVNFPNYLKDRQMNGKRHCVMCGEVRVCSTRRPTTKRAPSDNNNNPQVEEEEDEEVEEEEEMTHTIPGQNKSICTACDVAVWVVLEAKEGLEIKWCKGCKNFRALVCFGKKVLGTKCERCRERQREMYAAKKRCCKT